MNSIINLDHINKNSLNYTHTCAYAYMCKCMCNIYGNECSIYFDKPTPCPEHGYSYILCPCPEHKESKFKKCLKMFCCCL